MPVNSTHPTSFYKLSTIVELRKWIDPRLCPALLHLNGGGVDPLPMKRSLVLWKTLRTGMPSRFLLPSMKSPDSKNPTGQIRPIRDVILSTRFPFLIICLAF
jgi:hypothetical protein